MAEEQSVAPKELTAGSRHPHPLSLVKTPIHYYCDICKLDGFGRRYQCKEKGCKATLHETCVLCPDVIDNFFLHPQHQLTFQRSRNPLTTHTCEVCGFEAPGYFYRCKPCSFEIHPCCSVFGTTLSDPSHPAHPLTFQPRVAKAAARFPCAVCRGKCGDQKHGGTYVCASGCAAQVHVSCLNTPGYPYVPPDADEQAAKWKASKEVHDSNHPHPLVPRRNLVVFTCDRCKCPGYGPRYRCVECKISIHETCATCPETISFFMHPEHTLVLERSYNPFNNHTCEVCGAHAHGYFYRCKPCSFELHPFCSHLQPTITDAAHPGHTLRYNTDGGKGTPCSVCGKDCDKWRYSCDDCGAHLHMKCLDAAGHPKVPAKDQEGVKVEGGNKGKGKKAMVYGAIGAAVVLGIVLAAVGEESEGLFNFEREGDDGDDDFDFEEEYEEEYEEEEEEEVEEEVEEEEESESEEEEEQEEENKEEEKEEKQEEQKKKTNLLKKLLKKKKGKKDSKEQDNSDDEKKKEKAKKEKKTKKEEEKKKKQDKL